MTNKEKYQRAFSQLHPSNHFKVKLEDNMMKHTLRFRNAFVAFCVVLALAAGGATVYAADIGGIQRTIQIWLNGDQTDVTLTINESDGSYAITDDNGDIIQSGGGIAIEADGSERPLTSEEIYEELTNQVTTDHIDGRMYLLYKNQKIDVTDKFADNDYCYLTLKDGDETLYVTVGKDGTMAVGQHRYMQPGVDFW